jgi:hypothetical protein
MITKSTDFGSQGTKSFEIRSVGTAPLTIQSVAFDMPNPEFSLSIVDAQQKPATLPVQLSPNRDANAPAQLVITVSYHSSSGQPASRPA